MLRPSAPLILLPLALLAACPPGDQDPGASSGSGATTGSSESSSTSSASTSTGEPTPTTTGTSEPTTSGSSTTGDPVTTEGTTTEVDPGTTQPVDTTGSETTGSDTTGTTADETTDTGDTADIPDTTGGELCEPGADEVDIEWALEVPPAMVGLDIDADCQIVSAVEAEPDVAVTLNCDLPGEPQQVVLQYTLLPFRDLEWTKDQVVQLDYRADQAPFPREWLRVGAGVTRLWGVHADVLAPPGITVEQFYEREISLGAPCDPQPDPCGQRQGLELGFEYVAGDMDAVKRVRSGERIIFGFPVPTLVWVEHADRLLEPIGCADVAPRRFDMMVATDASGL